MDSTTPGCNCKDVEERKKRKTNAMSSTSQKGSEN